MIGRYFQAFIRALDLTLRKETPQTAQLRASHPHIANWCKETVHVLDVIERALVKQKIDPQKIMLRSDGRDQSMITILTTVRFHAQQEYPYLISGGDPYSLLTLQATNLNDRFLVDRLAQISPLTIQTDIKALSAHLAHPPKD